MGLTIWKNAFKPRKLTFILLIGGLILDILLAKTAPCHTSAIIGKPVGITVYKACYSYWYNYNPVQQAIIGLFADVVFWYMIFSIYALEREKLKMKNKKTFIVTAILTAFIVLVYILSTFV